MAQRRSGDAGTSPAVASTPRSGPRAVTPAELAAGTMLGAYRVVRVLGRGGASTVYEVVSDGGERRAAKVVDGETDPTVVERLRNEAEATALVRDGGVVQLSAVAVERGRAYALMDLLEGETLRARIARGPVPAAEVRRIVSGLLRTLRAAHEVGIVHRDLKPENVFLVADGETTVPKLLDFGVGKLRDPVSRARDLRLTESGQVVGTPLYMAPEQIRATSDVEGGADLYSLGVVTYELLAGRRPFEASSIYDLVIRHATERPPDLRTLRPELPQAVADVVATALERDPAVRYTQAGQFLTAWERAWELAPKREEEPVGISRVAAVAIAIGVALVLGLGVALAWTSDPEPEAPVSSMLA